MEKVKCANPKCGKILTSEDLMYQVRLFHRDGTETWGGCCCKECAASVINDLAVWHENAAKEMRHQSPQKMKVADFGQW